MTKKSTTQETAAAGMTPQERAQRSMSERVEEVEVQILALRVELARLRLEQWAGRVDDLELQAHLGRMEAGDRVAALLADLGHRIARGRAQGEVRGEAAVEALEVITAGVERAFADLRDAVVQARHAVVR